AEDAMNAEKISVSDIAKDLKVSLISNPRITPNDTITFEVSYEVLKDDFTYIAFSLTDIDRNIWVYNDNSLDYPTQGIGRKCISYQCQLSQLNDIKLKLEVTVRDKNGQMLLFSTAEQSPQIVIQRNDIDQDDLSALDSASGLYQRNGKWVFH
ncbi:TPA: ABC transporter ATP-binding protein, partial [Streptococcus pyogenes]